MSATTSAHAILGASSVDAGGEIPGEFWLVVERHRSELVNQALAILGNLEDAEDVAQETFCEVFRDRERMRSMQSLGGWLRTVNRANALNRLRGRRRDGLRAERKRRELPSRSMTTGGFSLLELRESVAKAIEALPPELREAVILRYWEHRSYGEIAQRLGIPQGTVWRRLSDASLALFQRLQVHLEGAPDTCTPVPPQEPQP